MVCASGVLSCCDFVVGVFCVGGVICSYVVTVVVVVFVVVVIVDVVAVVVWLWLLLCFVFL